MHAPLTSAVRHATQQPGIGPRTQGSSAARKPGGGSRTWSRKPTKTEVGEPFFLTLSAPPLGILVHSNASMSAEQHRPGGWDLAVLVASGRPRAQAH